MRFHVVWSGRASVAPGTKAGTNVTADSGKGYVCRCDRNAMTRTIATPRSRSVTIRLI